jgi:4-amino-4-deoxy-L-arabinose transferase-like glycosyltransferase
MIALLLAATLFRTVPLLDNRFHPDEALYGSFARRIASGRDPLLSGVLVDKPPLGFYLMALGELIGGHGRSELGVRLPSLYAGVVGVALLYALGRRLYSARTAALAAGLLAASPFTILFSITLFLDSLLAAAVLWALAAAARQRWWALAAALALGFAIKQTALLFLPLVLTLALVRLPAHASPRAVLGLWWSAARRVVPALALTTLAIVAWDAARQYSIGFWSQGYADNMPGRLVRANEVLPRARAWLNLLYYATASRLLNAVALAGVAGRLVTGARAQRASLADGVLAGYVVAYLGAYWLLAFNVWDRYLLPLLPLIFLLMARGLLWLSGYAVNRLLLGLRTSSRRLHNLAQAVSHTSLLEAPPALEGKGAGGLGLPRRELVFTLLVSVALLPGALGAMRSAYPIGGDHGPYDGVDDAARYLASLPDGSVLYDHWLSWQWNYYLFDAPVYVAWMPTPEAFAADLLAFGAASPRFLAVPSWEQDAELRAAASSVGYAFAFRHASHRRDGTLGITIYQLVPDGASRVQP